MKKCFKCGEEKPIDDFYKHPQMADGHLGKCKECTKADVSKNYRKNIKHYAWYEAARKYAPHRKLYKKIKQRLDRQNKVPRKVAYDTIGQLLRLGKIERKPCEVCGALHAEAHHDDYNKPLEVRWLCRKHHMEVHGKNHFEFLREAQP